jgi:thymidylate synthase ThyX
MREQEIESKRRSLKTYPDIAPREDPIFFDLRHLRVEMVDYPTNPYKAIYRIVISTWGSRKNWWLKWENSSPEERFEVVKAALEGNTLPQCLEAPSFTFAVQGVSRASFDQWARHRHIAIGSVGSRDDAHLDAALVVPPSLKPYAEKIRTWWKITKDLYEEIVTKGKQSWQAARFILPHGMEWRFAFACNYRGFRDICAQRMCFAEQYDTVALAWACWNEMWKRFPLLAAYSTPACDKAQKCLYSKPYTLSEMFGNLFLPCGRWPIPEKPYAIFNEVSCTREQIMELTGMWIPEPKDWERLRQEAKERDWHFFEK